LYKEVILNIINVWQRRDKGCKIFILTGGIFRDLITVKSFYPWLRTELHPKPCSQNSLNALAIDEPLEYARLALDGEMQAWVDAIDSLEVW